MSKEPDNELRDIDPLILGGLAQAVPQVEPSAELRGRVLDHIHGDRSAVTPIRSTASIRPQSRGLGVWPLATAASLMLVAGLAVYTTQLRSRIRSLESELRDANIRAAASQQQIADAERAAARAESSMAVLTAPDAVRVDLAGQPAAPAASARAFWSRSRGLVITGTNLPQLPSGRSYQLWVVTAQAPISAGLLTPDAQGRVSGTFATPSDIPAPVAMAVTIEPAGGVPAPTGDKFLVGTL